MGIRSIERRLAAELCYEVVVQAVRDYLAESRRAGRLADPFEHLVVPIIRAGFYPPGLLSVKHLIIRREEGITGVESGEGSKNGAIYLPEDDFLIEAIMGLYSTMLRAAARRAAMKLQG